jgi:catechol 2,3-dioxygenase-like lactoylglutathione lyase family enzyme
MTNRPKLVPELYCSNLRISLDFYCELLGFNVRYARPEDGFAYLELAGVELMLEEIEAGQTESNQGWNTGVLEQPFGRGINLQFEIGSVDNTCLKITQAGWPIFLEIHDAWYRADDMEIGNRQFLVLDPDGYQLRPFTSLGTRIIPKPCLIANGK